MYGWYSSTNGAHDQAYKHPYYAYAYMNGHASSTSYPYIVPPASKQLQHQVQSQHQHYTVHTACQGVHPVYGGACCQTNTPAGLDAQSAHCKYSQCQRKKLDVEILKTQLELRTSEVEGLKLEIGNVQCNAKVALVKANSAKRDLELEVSKLKEELVTMKKDRDKFEAKVIETLRMTRVSSKALLHEVRELEDVIRHQMMVRKAADLRVKEVLSQQPSETIMMLVDCIRSAYSGEPTWQNRIYMRKVSQ